MIPFNIPPCVGTEEGYISEAISCRKLCGDGEFTKQCSVFLEKMTGCDRALLTTSCTHALEMAAILADIKPGDEVIMPSYTFVTTANSFVMRGAEIVFVDICPDTMNIDENLIEDAVTPRTKVIVPVHYAGVGCEMGAITGIAERHGLIVAEDNAQGIMSSYMGRPLGTFGTFGCLSFHETKNLSMGEGGALLINDKNYVERAEIIREKGTNRSRFLRGQVDKYTWVDRGSSYLPSELNAAYLLAQLDHAEQINADRLASWNRYFERLRPLSDKGAVELPFIPEHCAHNAHMFYLKTKDIGERTRLISFLKERGIGTAFHYVPLHSSPAGKKYGRFHGEDRFTTKESERLLRLPMYYGLTESDIDMVCCGIYDFYEEK